ncbi:MAG: DUF3445 domain-containing protein [Aliishimia sp.]
MASPTLRQDGGRIAVASIGFTTPAYVVFGASTPVSGEKMHTEILQSELPEDMRKLRGLPGIQPVNGAWLRVDDAYSGQMARRLALLDRHRVDVLACPEVAMTPALEVLDNVVPLLPALGYVVQDAVVQCPDGRDVHLDRKDPLDTLGRLLQCDLCLLHKPQGAQEHLLGAAVLCFPASWSLHEKIGRPMMAIHSPVDEYDDSLGRRVQRLLDGVQVGRPLWRFNSLFYEDAELHQPRSETAPREDLSPSESRPFNRAERQTLLRLPESRWVLFAIHTYVVVR